MMCLIGIFYVNAQTEVACYTGGGNYRYCRVATSTMPSNGAIASQYYYVSTGSTYYYNGKAFGSSGSYGRIYNVGDWEGGTALNESSPSIEITNSVNYVSGYFTADYYILKLAAHVPAGAFGVAEMAFGW